MNDTAAVPHLPEDPSAAAAAAGRNNLLLEKDNLVNNPASTGALSLVCRRIGTGECLELRVSPHESVADVRARLAIAQAGAAALTTSTHSPTAPSIKTSDVYMVYCGRCLRDSDRVVDVVGQKANSSNVLPIYYSISARSQALSPENTHSPHTPMKAALLGSPFTSPSSSSGSRGVMMSPRSVAAALQWLEMCDPRVHSEQARRVRDVLAACGIDAPPTWVPSIETCYAYRLEDLDDFDDLNSLDGDGDAGAAADSVTPGAAAAGAAEAAPEAPEPPIPRPNWIDLYIIPNIVVGLYLFGEKLSLPAQVAGEFRQQVVKITTILYNLNTIFCRIFIHLYACISNHSRGGVLSVPYRGAPLPCHLRLQAIHQTISGAFHDMSS